MTIVAKSRSVQKRWQQLTRNKSTIMDRKRETEKQEEVNKRRRESRTQKKKKKKRADERKGEDEMAQEGREQEMEKGCN